MAGLRANLSFHFAPPPPPDCETVFAHKILPFQHKLFYYTHHNSVNSFLLLTLRRRIFIVYRKPGLGTIQRAFMLLGNLQNGINALGDKVVFYLPR